MNKPWLAHYEDGVPASLEYPPIPLHQMLEDSAAKYPKQSAVKMVLRYLPGGKIIGAEMTYAELKDKVDRLATALHDLGVRKGDRVAIQLPNSPHTVIAFFACLKLGAIVVNTNPIYTPREMEHQFVDSGAETLILLNSFYPKLKEIQDKTQIKRVVICHINDFTGLPFSLLVRRAQQKEGQWVDVPEGKGVYHLTSLLKRFPATPPKVEVKPEDVALFQYTGGTTGVPKAAMLSHRNLVANVLQCAHWLTDLEPGREIFMGAIPFFHVFGMTVAMALCVYVGGKLIVVPNPRPIDNVMNQIQRERCSIFPGVPAMYIGIINHPEVSKYDLRSVKACISGAAPLPMEVQERFGELTGGRLVEGYGLTEAAPVTHCNPIYGRRKAGSIGIPLPDVEAKLVSLEPGPDGKPVEVGVGQEGELAIRGPQVMVGYWNKPEETANVKDAEGWLYTGDIAKMDEDGYFYIVDRKKDLIIASGYNIVPREVEEVLFMHPAVQEAVVAGVPHPVRGETVKAYVVLKPGKSATADEIIAFCRQHLAAYKVPSMVEFRSELPKSMVGKFLRRVLVEEEKQKLAAQQGQRT
ncbi:MAG: long-chain fatty acid--CoA ligase [Caldilineales bacterium]|nr:long-chain fatty acid--CoA ligase [Caldilineales bacterium]MDW8316939.1 long-chain fatty acid--CoA ligase [Anaerolineae bacterium]